jgi:uncharacterized membrane protein YfcA
MILAGAFIVGFLASLISALSTGGALISIPGVIFLGFSPLTAIATTRLSGISGSLAAIYKFQKAKLIAWQLLPVLFAITVASGIIGPRLLARVSGYDLQPTIGWVLLLMLPMLLLRPSFGTTESNTSPSRKVAGGIVLFLIMVFGTMFGVGGGTFLLYALIYFFGMTITQANASGMVLWLTGAVTAFVSYATQGAVDYVLAIPLVLGSLVGGYTGAHVAVKKGAAWVKWLLVVVIIISSIKLILFS